MKKCISYIIASVLVVGVLLFAWFWQSTPEPQITQQPQEIQTEDTGELYADENVDNSVNVQVTDLTQQEKSTEEKQIAQTPKLPEVPSQATQEPAGEEVSPPKNIEVEETVPENTVSLTVDCSDILSNMDSLKKEKHGLVPNGGIMFSDSDIEITEGESVFDVLKRALTASGVHLEFNLAPVTNSAYIEGIGNIYEFDCGERSGWKFSVNGEYPRVGCSDFKIKPGDKIVFVYKVKAY